MSTIVKEVHGCCRVVLHKEIGRGGSFYISITDDFINDPRIGYDCLIRAIGDALIEAGVEITGGGANPGVPA